MDKRPKKPRKKKPPKCPNCGEPLERVAMTDYITATWNSEKGYFEEEGSLEMRCTKCDADLSDIFPEGVCNYHK
jgi:uncharacterized protein with PIN domain